MSVTFEATKQNLLTVRATGKFRTEDYERFVPAVDKLAEANGSIRIFVDMEDFDGNERGAAWQDLELSLRQLDEVERLAMVGDNAWERWMASFCQPFTKAEVRFYARSEADAARAWIEER